MAQPSDGNLASRQEVVHRGCPSESEHEDGGEDRISGLPDALLLLVLGGLGSTEEAARTSVLSRRWCSLWLGLPVLAFRGVGPDLLVDLLARATRPKLSRLEIRVPRRDGGISTAQVYSLLRAAKERKPAELIFDICNRSFTLPPAGDFAKLVKLTLSLCCVDPDDFLSRCPLLRVLDICFYWMQASVAINSNSFQELVLKDVTTRHGNRTPQLVHIAAPALTKFRLQSCGNRELITTCSQDTVVESPFFKYCSKLSRSVGLIGFYWRLLSLSMATEWTSRDGEIDHVRVLSLVILADNVRLLSAA
ncbi:hypothetical protein BAE44_0002399 [Dichanthelium oligosanthes]|uniref:F-box domain-containing protein n=1 Tax=Dichanthelium oligosanthes TaxID=888268 RepID=A0A1E5WGR0_9POAL|nr:hypothetical protein BAE44_0002399 [Dichanthelium oligosanthes]